MTTNDPMLRRLVGLLLPVLAACGAGSERSLDPPIAKADSVVALWVGQERVPGAVLRVSRAGVVEFERAYGAARLDPFRPMGTDVAFDLASVTKVMATTMAVMLLVDRGLVELDAPVQRYLPDFGDGGKAAITLEHLLTHTSGLAQWQPTYYHASNPDEAYAYVRDLELEWPVGEARHYSDLGFMVLGSVVEAVTNQTLDGFLSGEFYGPLGLERTVFRPEARHGPFAATSHGNPFERRMVYDSAFGYRIDVDPDSWTGWRDYVLEGEVNDGNAHHAFGGVAGHAGLFSTAVELDILLQLMLNQGVHRDRRIVSAEVVRRFLSPTGDSQALGWQLPDYAPEGSFGHTGFTGTFVLGIPAARMGVVLLTNRQNGDVDAETRYPDVAPLQRAVVEALTADRVPTG